MHIAQYFVVFHDNEWRIRYKGTFYGPYDRQKTAISQAIDMALIVGQSGGKAEVLVENEKGEARLEWPLSHDQATADRNRFMVPPPAPEAKQQPASATPAAPTPITRSAPPPVLASMAAPAVVSDSRHDDALDEGHDEEPTPPRESSIEELAAIMAAALDGAEATNPAPDQLPLLPGDDEGPGTIDADAAADPRK